MKHILIAILGAVLFISLLLWLVPWLANGGLPASEPAGDSLPPHIQYVLPEDGQLVNDPYGFCVHYDYQAGSGMDPFSQDTRYYFDGRNVTGQVYDINELEYPTQVGEPCYRRTEPLGAGWHTAKVTYVDLAGNRLEYIWRFQVIQE